MVSLSETTAVKILVQTLLSPYCIKRYRSFPHCTLFPAIVHVLASRFDQLLTPNKSTLAKIIFTAKYFY